MKIFHNISAMLAGNALDKSQRAGAKSIGKLSSGLRINDASDDAAGLSISEKMRSQIGGLDQARRNSQDGISMIQTAEGALNESHSALQRMRELSVQAANDTLTSNDRQHIQRELDQLVDELDNIARNTKFNKKSLLDGSASALWSVNDPSVSVVVRDNLDIVDGKGNVKIGEGNFLVALTAKDPGQGEVKKSHIFPVVKDGKEVTLSEIPSFYDNGRPILDPSKSLYLEQGDGGTVEVVVYNTDTVEDLRRKLDDAVGNGLGQNSLAKGLEGFFTSISSGKVGTVESIRTEKGTMSLPVKPIDEVLTNGVTATFPSGAVAFAAITKGSTDVLLHLNDNGAPDSIQIFTRDGVLLAGVDPPEVTVPITEANGFLPGATYQPTGPLVNPAYNNVSPYNQVVYKGTDMAYSGSDNPGLGDLNEYFFIKESPEDLLVFVTGNGVFDITATWTEIKKQGEYSSDYSLSAPLILRSAVPGNDGRINLSGDDDLLKALGFSVVQQSREPIREVLVKDAHSGDVTSSGTIFSGNMVVGVVNPGIDMSIEPSNAVNVRWSDESKGFVLSGGDMSFVVHLSDNKTVLQTGANEGEKVGILFSDATARGLGLLPPSPSVLNKDLAGGTLSRIDRAINTVSTERTRLGAYQNRLEHTISNVTVASQNLLESKSRIKDLDMAKEMMNFTKINILLQSGTSILAQANQSPDGVLQLLKGQ